MGTSYSLVESSKSVKRCIGVEPLGVDVIALSWRDLIVQVMASARQSILDAAG